jgi:hypothetical protein
MTEVWQGPPHPLALTREKFMRDLQQDPRAIPSLWIAATSSPMTQVQQNFQSLSNDLVRSSPIDVGNKTNTAAILLELRIVKPLLGG